MTLPPNITAGVPFSATLKLCDLQHNITDGYDDRDLLTVKIDGSVEPKILVRLDKYFIDVPVPKKGEHELLVEAKKLISPRRQLNFNPTVVFNPKTASARGLGLSNDAMGEVANILISLDYSGDNLEYAAVFITMKSNGFETSAPVQYNTPSSLCEATYTRPAKYGEYELVDGPRLH